MDPRALCCPYCGGDTETGYLRGNKGYALIWTDDPFKITSHPFGNDFWLCHDTDLEKPMARLCRSCGKIIVEVNKQEL